MYQLADSIIKITVLAKLHCGHLLGLGQRVLALEETQNISDSVDPTGIWRCLVFAKLGFMSLPCVLMHELLSNLVLAVLYMLMQFRQEKNTDVIQAQHQYFHNAPVEKEAAGRPKNFA